jgi:hypothetical protein
MASWWRAGPRPPTTEGAPDAVARTAVAALAAASGLVVEPGSIRVVPADEGPLGFGHPVAAWFAARETAEAPRDLYRLPLRLTDGGVPTATEALSDVTATADGDEALLDVDGDRVLYGLRLGGRFGTAVVLDFGDDGAADAGPAVRLVTAVAARQMYGTWTAPRRVDIALSLPPDALAGGLTAGGVALTAGEGAEARTIRVDLATGRVEPPGAARVVDAAPPPPELGALIADTLRRSPAFGPAAVIALEAFAFDAADDVRRAGHAFFPSDADRVPVPSTPEPAAATPASWPPAAIPAPGGLTGEGTWTPAGPPPLDGATAPILHAFVRVDPDRPFQVIHLFAFDSARLALHFVAGTRDPRSTTGVRGTGRIPEADRPRLVAAFNGGFKTEHGAFGTIEADRVLVPPLPGLATVLLDDDGRAAFGVWDGGESLPPGFAALRQNLPPLLADGRVNPTRSHHWGRVVERLDSLQTPRSALGVTPSGVLLFAWAPAASAEQLGEALRRAGATFALHLDMNPGHTGLELYAPASDGEPHASPGAPEMDFRPRRWLGTDARDFFYLTTLPPPPERTGDIRWTPVGAARRPDDPYPLVAAATVGPARLLRLEADRLRPVLVPGLGEERPVAPAPPAADLAGVPVARLDIGLLGPERGMVVDGRIWQAPRPGAMTFAVDDRGRAFVGRWGRGALDPARRWTVVRQGEGLLEDGRLAEGAGGRAGTPFAALGRDAAGRLLLAARDDGQRVDLAATLRAAGAVDALILGDRATAETGAMQVANGGIAPRLAPGAGSALAFVPRDPEPRAFVLPTFAR